MVKYGSYYYLFYSVGKCCGYDASRPPAGAEYKIKVCRSGTATGGFVSTFNVSGVMCYVSTLLTMRSRSTPQESLAHKAAVLSCSSRMAMSTVLVARAFTTILSRAGCCTTITSTLILGMLLGRSSLVGTRLLGRMGGRRCRPSVGLALGKSVRRSE